MTKGIREAINRDSLFRAFGNDHRLIRAFETQAETVDSNNTGLQQAVEATNNIDEATVLVLSSNTAFKNERVLKLGDGLEATDKDGFFIIDLSASTPKVNGGFRVFLTVAGDASIQLPLNGKLATIGEAETFQKKTLDKPKLIPFGDYLDDTAAAAGGCPIGGLYRTANIVKVRIV